MHRSKENSFREQITAHAITLNDDLLLKKIGDIGLDKDIYYHNECKLAFLRKQCDNSSEKHSDWHDTREMHDFALKEIVEYVRENVIKKKSCCMLQFLTSYYRELLMKACTDRFRKFDSVFTSQHLQDKLKKAFTDDEIRIVIMHGEKIVVPGRGRVIDQSIFTKLEESEALSRAAFILRKYILTIIKRPLPANLTVADLIAGECDVPQELGDFCQDLLCGCDPRTVKSFECSRRVRSLSQDVIYAVTHGRIKTSKHINYGMALKSMSSCRKILDMSNRYGHSCSYNVIEELETEATYTVSSTSNICPEGVKLSPNYSTGVAFDNYDRYFETRTGKDTLHDTFGLAYQNDDPTYRPVLQDSSDNTDLGPRPAKRRRTYSAFHPDLPTDSLQVKVCENMLPNDHTARQVTPSNCDFIKKLDYMWLFSHFLNVSNTPMWVGFNSKVVEDDSLKQNVFYLTPIPYSPTNKNVVYETMRQAQKVAEECQQKYIQVTYDLAIARIAYQIQSTKKPEFDNLFIHLGGFHIMMSHFKAVGKFIDGCGLTDIMVESELLAGGSVNGFITGKHFNRCKRLHPLVSLGLRILFLENFLKRREIQLTHDVIQVVQEFQSKKLTDTFFSDNRELNKILTEYAEHEQKILTGDFGKTAQFYAMYITFIDHHLTFSRSIRTGDFELYKFIIPKLINLFFTFNHVNYARWLTFYHNNLLKVEQTHPGLENEFRRGYFGIKRTNKPFSRIPIDLTLEQTVNADAARKLTGVTHFTNSIAARQRWAKNSSIRSTIVTHTYEDCGLKRAQDVTSDLEKNRIRQDSMQLHNFIGKIKENVNPIDSPALNDSFL